LLAHLKLGGGGACLEGKKRLAIEEHIHLVALRIKARQDEPAAASGQRLKKLGERAPLVADLHLVTPLAARPRYPRPRVRGDQVEVVGRADRRDDVAAEAH